MIQRIVSAALVFTVASLLSTQVDAQQNLFSQYSTTGASPVQASIYPAPHPVPPHVGGTFSTYEPLMPHELLYTHSRNYYRYTGGPEENYRDPYGSPRAPGGGSINVTKVRWQAGSIGLAPNPFSFNPLASWKYNCAKRFLQQPGYTQYPTNPFSGLGAGARGCLNGACGKGLGSGGLLGGGVGSSFGDSSGFGTGFDGGFGGSFDGGFIESAAPAAPGCGTACQASQSIQR